MFKTVIQGNLLNILILLLTLTRVPGQTQECSALLSFPEEHQRSLRHRWTVSPFSSQSSSQLSHECFEGETESHYYL